jgi:hypothetical protein
MTENKNMQALTNPDSDFMYQDEVNISEAVEYHIMFQSKKFSDFYISNQIQDQVKNILYDNQDDKLGRIKELYDAEIQKLARFANDHHTENEFAKFMYNEMLKNVV